MSQRSIKGPARIGTVSVESVAADAAELRAMREVDSAGAAGKRRTPSAAFMKPMTPSAALAAIIGDKAMPRAEVTKRVWAYIKKNGLQDKVKGTMINADAKLKDVLGRSRISSVDLQKQIDRKLI
jgi:chromatin remodeling complex protein RSC6